MPTSEPAYPGAVAPERSRDFESNGIRLRLNEWGDPDAAPVVLCHGMFDHGRGFDTLAPFLAERFRVVAIDARGHGDSGWADAYTWMADVADIGNVMGSLGRPCHLLGHSKGGGQATEAACQYQGLVRQLVNIDGFGPSPEGFRPPGFEVDPRSLPERFATYLDRRREGEERSWRAYASLDDLVARRSARTRGSPSSGCATSSTSRRGPSRAASSGRPTPARPAASGRGSRSGRTRTGTGSARRCSR